MGSRYQGNPTNVTLNLVTEDALHGGTPPVDTVGDMSELLNAFVSTVQVPIIIMWGHDMIGCIFLSNITCKSQKNLPFLGHKPYCL